MEGEELLNVLKELAETRPVFYSEKDFQHELAWIIHPKGYSIRMGLPVRRDGGKTEHLDILASAARDRGIGIELKYLSGAYFPSREKEEVQRHCHNSPRFNCGGMWQTRPGISIV